MSEIFEDFNLYTVHYDLEKACITTDFVENHDNEIKLFFYFKD